MSKTSSSFIKLDNRLIRVLGLNNAVVFCHLQGIQGAINYKRDNQDAIYQQLDRLIYDLGLSKATIIKSIKYLESLKLLHTIKGTEGNKTKYLIDKFNYNKLMDIINDIENPKTKKTKENAINIKRDVLNLYNEWYKNNTTSSDNFDTTNKDLIEKDKNKKIKSSRQFLSNCIHQPITINYYEDSILLDSVTYQFIPLYFKDSYKEDDIYKTLNNSHNVNYQEHQILEYFLKSYYKYYGYLHKQDTAPKIREILQTIHNIIIDYLASLDLNYKTMYDVIDEYFNTPNTKKRDLTLYLLLSKSENGVYSWIDTIITRIIV